MKIGVVGVGSIGARHANNIASLGHHVICYDPLTRRDVAFERNVYEECDAVVVATPTWLHAAGLRAAIDRGKPVLMEKPLGIASPEVYAELIDRAEKNNITVMMGNNLRFHPCVCAAKDWISKGHIGKPVWAKFISATKTSKKTYRDDGVILNTGAHEVDYALHLLGPAKVVSAWAHVAEDGTDDIAEFVLEHDNGCISSFSLNYVTENEIRESWVAGTDKNIGLDLFGRGASFGKILKGYGGSYFNDYIDEMAAFIARINGKEALGATGWEGLVTMELLLEVRRMAGLA